MIKEGETSAHQRLLTAALEALATYGYRGATTRIIAEAAGVTELTLFRHFGSKQHLMQEALHYFTPMIALPDPSDDVEHDLLALGQAYLDLIAADGGLFLRLLSELLRHPELLANHPPTGILQTFERVMALFRHHQQHGRLTKNEPAETLALAFIGPLMARFLLGNIFSFHIPLDLPQYVQGFLTGRSANRA